MSFVLLDTFIAGKTGNWRALLGFPPKLYQGNHPSIQLLGKAPLPKKLLLGDDSLCTSCTAQNLKITPDIRIKKKPKKVNELIPLSEGAERRRLQAGKALHRGTGAAQLAQDAAPSLRRQEPLHGTHQSKIRLGRWLQKLQCDPLNGSPEIGSICSSTIIFPIL